MGSLPPLGVSSVETGLLAEHHLDDGLGFDAVQLGLGELAAGLAFDAGEVLEVVHHLTEGCLLLGLGCGGCGFVCEELGDCLVGCFAVAEADVASAVAVAAGADGDGEFDFLGFVAVEGCGGFHAGDAVGLEEFGCLGEFGLLGGELVSDGLLDVLAELGFGLLELGDVVGECLLAGEQFLLTSGDSDGDHVVGCDLHVDFDVLHGVGQCDVAHSSIPLWLVRSGRRSDESQ